MSTDRKTRHLQPESTLMGRLSAVLLGAGASGAESIEGAAGHELAERSRGLGELAAETRGAMFVEYVALLCLVTVGGAAAIVTLGAPLVALARFTQLVIGLPIP